jgi:polysaccharide export outer membrane protein
MKRTTLGWFVLLLCITLVSFASAQTRPAAGPTQTPARPAQTPAGPAQAPAGSGSAPGAIPPLPGTARNTEPPSYIIQPNDVLRIYVWKDEALSQPRTLVRPDGRISINLVQDIQAAGLSPVQLKLKLEEKLREWVDVPNVTVIVDTIQPIEVYMMGNVATPGVLRNPTPLTIVQALGTAGGFSEYADKEGVMIIRGKDRIKFNFEDFIKRKIDKDNVMLMSGDVVWVP